MWRLKLVGDSGDYNTDGSHLSTQKCQKAVYDGFQNELSGFSENDMLVV